MTTRQTRTHKSNTQLRGLKWLLTAGSLAAALLGTRLLAANDAAVTAVASTNASQPEIILVPAPQTQGSTVQITPRRIELAPVPTAAAPVIRPIVRSRSSR